MHFNNYNYTLITCANYPYRISMFLNYTLQTNKISGTQTTRRTLTLTNGKQEKLNDWYFIDWKNGTIFLSKGDHMNMNVFSIVRNLTKTNWISYLFIDLSQIYFINLNWLHTLDCLSSIWKRFHVANLFTHLRGWNECHIFSCIYAYLQTFISTGCMS